MNTAKQYFPVVPFITLCKVVLTFDSVDKILKCDHWKAVHYATQGDPDICVCNESSGHSNMSRWAGRFCGGVVMLYKVIHTFNCVDEIRGSICFTFLNSLVLLHLTYEESMCGINKESPKTRRIAGLIQTVSKYPICCLQHSSIARGFKVNNKVSYHAALPVEKNEK